MLTLYWVYDLPNWVFGLLCIGTFMAFGLAGLPLTRMFAKRVHAEDHSHNDIVGYYLAAVTVFYGITLGLVAVGTWNNYSMVQDRVDREAQTIASLYRDVAAYPAPLDSQLENDLRSYVREVIDRSWPLQRRGIMPTGRMQSWASCRRICFASLPRTWASRFFMQRPSDSLISLLRLVGQDSIA